MDVAAQRYGWALWLLTLGFLLRVLGQVIQCWAPQPYLPPFHSFQGSNLPYPVLFSVQVILLAIMVRTAHRVQTAALPPSDSAGRILCRLGAIYLGLSLVRIAIGLLVPPAPEWFRTWIPAIFHVVLATYVVVLGRYHRWAQTRG